MEEWGQLDIPDCSFTFDHNYSEFTFDDAELAFLNSEADVSVESLEEIPRTEVKRPKFRLILRKEPEMFDSEFASKVRKKADSAVSNSLRRRPLTRSTETFDIVVYLNYHGVCAMPKLVRQSIFYPKKLSMLRASSFGVASYRLFGLNEHTVMDTLQKTMDVNPSKLSVVLALQNMFRTHKASLDEVRTSFTSKMSFRERREYDMERNEIGWEAIIDGNAFHDTTYHTGKGFRGGFVVYDKLGVYGLSPLDWDSKTLSELVSLLEHQGYKNICVINDACNSNDATPRQNALAVKNSSAFGGTRRKRKLKSRKLYKK